MSNLVINQLLVKYTLTAKQLCPPWGLQFPDDGETVPGCLLLRRPLLERRHLNTVQVSSIKLWDLRLPTWCCLQRATQYHALFLRRGIQVIRRVASSLPCRRAAHRLHRKHLPYITWGDDQVVLLCVSRGERGHLLISLKAKLRFIDQLLPTCCRTRTAPGASSSHL